jgi:molecular chaperone DnaK
VQFEIDANGILHVLARDIATGKQTVVEMKSAVDVADTDVQKMVEESVEHAFEDMAARQWIEAKLRAQGTIAAARKGMASCGPDLEAACRERIQDALAAVEAVLGVEDPQTKIGNTNQLKSAIANLDTATEPLADLMMDKAMEAMLRKRGVIAEGDAIRHEERGS